MIRMNIIQLALYLEDGGAELDSTLFFTDLMLAKVKLPNFFIA